MKYLPFLLAGWWRNSMRQFINSSIIVLAFFLFAITLSLSYAFSSGTRGIGSEQLIVSSKVSQGTLLPLKFAADLRGYPGVLAVSHASWFGGYYREPKNAVPLLAVDSNSHFSANPDFVIDKSLLKKWQETKNGLVVGSDLAKKFGINVGQRFNLSSYLWKQSDGNSDWDFVVSAVYTVKDGSANNAQAMFMHYDYLNDNRQRSKDMVNIFVVLLRNAELGQNLSKKIDDLNANSEYETKTSSAAILAQSYLVRIVRINKILLPLIILVILTTFFIISSSLVNNIRQRLNEIAVFKVIGFDSFKISIIFFSEIFILFFSSSFIGMLLAKIFLISCDAWLKSYLPNLYLGIDIFLLGFLLSVSLTIGVGIIPVWHIRRVNIVEQLRQ